MLCTKLELKTIVECLRVKDPALIVTVTGEHLRSAEETTIGFLEAHTVFRTMLQDFRLIGTQALRQGAPFDIDDQYKLSFHPFNEAATEADLAVFFIQRGMYKSFYHHLRSFFELYLLATYFLAPQRRISEAHAWLDGKDKTPFMTRMLTALFAEEEQFCRAQHVLQLKDMLQKTYGQFCDIVHNRGEKCGHVTLAKANFPRFLPETFEIGMEDFRNCIELVCITFALRCPLILVGFPMLEKFGVNPPLSGFLDEMEAAAIRKYISPEGLTFLDDFIKKDEWVISATNWVRSKPDMSQEQIAEQLHDWQTRKRD